MSFLDAHGRFWNGDYTFWMPRVVFETGDVLFGCPGSFFFEGGRGLINPLIRLGLGDGRILTGFTNANSSC